MSPADAKLLLLRVLRWVTPVLDHAVVAGSPDEDESAVEIALELSRRLPVSYLVAQPPSRVDWLLRGAPGPHRVTCLPKESPRALWAYLTARYVFFTHGLYGSPTPPSHKPVVNLWHGDGPKRRKGFAVIRSTYVVAGTELWGSRRAKNFDLPARRVLITGNPRIDRFDRPATDAAVRRLGLDPDRPLVLWLPTYRRTEYRGRRLGAVRNWADSTELSTALGGDLSDVAQVAESLGIALVVKPHPLDADDYRATGLPVLTSADLNRANVGLYQLLGRTRGLITDYSSVWTDYLALDRPIGYFCPDIEEYEAGRGLNVDDYLGLIAGPHLEDLGDFRAFLEECLEESSESKQHRKEAVARIGAVTELGASRRVLDAVGVRPVRPGRRGDARTAS